MLIYLIDYEFILSFTLLITNFRISKISKINLVIIGISILNLACIIIITQTYE